MWPSDAKALYPFHPRENGDCGDDRKMSTPFPVVILENLDNFRKLWSTLLSFEDMNRARLEIDHLSAHIKKGLFIRIKTR